MLQILSLNTSLGSSNPLLYTERFPGRFLLELFCHSSREDSKIRESLHHTEPSPVHHSCSKFIVGSELQSETLLAIQYKYSVSITQYLDIKLYMLYSATTGRFFTKENCLNTSENKKYVRTKKPSTLVQDCVEFSWQKSISKEIPKKTSNS